MCMGSQISKQSTPSKRDDLLSILTDALHLIKEHRLPYFTFSEKMVKDLHKQLIEDTKNNSLNTAF